jgi:hypothetical protein
MPYHSSVDGKVMIQDVLRRHQPSIYRRRPRRFPWYDRAIIEARVVPPIICLWVWMMPAQTKLFHRDIYIQIADSSASEDTSRIVTTLTLTIKDRTPSGLIPSCENDGCSGKHTSIVEDH